MTTRFSGLTARATLLTCAVALVSVLITAVVALPLALRAANAQSRAALAEKAQVAADAIEGETGKGAERVVQTLRKQGLEAVLVRGGRPDRAGLPAKALGALRSGRAFSGNGRYHGHPMMIEAVPAEGGDGIVLLQPPSGVRDGSVAARLWIALVVGLAAGVAAGVLLARLLARPLRRAAVAARQLSAGDRGVRLPVGPPDEVADLSRALNDLAAALATSEARQRTFLMSISHELRTPLTTLKGYAEALADGVVDAAETSRTGRTMLAEASRLDRLVADLLVLARLEADDFPLEVAPVDVAALLSSAAEAWAPRCAAVGVELRLDAAAGLPAVATDASRVRQVIDGLLENALRVVPAGAPVVLAARPGVIEVRDGGPGFTDDDLAVAFERGALYERYQGIRKVGSGLGLALAARLVSRLGGQISVGHAPEGGARFVVRLPA